MRDSSTKEWPASTAHAHVAARLPDPDPEGRGGEGHETHAQCLRPREGVRVVVVMVGALTAGIVGPASVLAERGGSGGPCRGLVGEGDVAADALPGRHFQ